MKQDEIIEMARQAGGWKVEEDDPQCSIGKIAFDLEELEAFAKLVAAKEREACAKILMSTDLGGLKNDLWLQHFIAEMLSGYTKAIRARGEA